MFPNLNEVYLNYAKQRIHLKKKRLRMFVHKKTSKHNFFRKSNKHIDSAKFTIRPVFFFSSPSSTLQNLFESSLPHLDIWNLEMCDYGPKFSNAFPKHIHTTVWTKMVDGVKGDFPTRFHSVVSIERPQLLKRVPVTLSRHYC